MGLHVSFIKEIPDVVISSTAVRALLTAKFAIKHGEWKCPLLFEPSIYGGSPSFLMKLINNQSNNLSSICLVGHEPNFSNFISQATGSNFIKFSTASLAKIDFDINIWKHITFGLGKLKWFVSPENLK